MKEKIKLFILGSTGSIGTQTLNIVRRNCDKFCVVGLSAGNDYPLLAKQANEFGVNIVGIANQTHKKALQALLPNAKVFCGEEAQTVCADTDANIVVAAVSGIIGIHGVVAALKASKKIALANKEVLVSAGRILMKLAKDNHTEILPIDSEHSAIKECLSGHKFADVKRLILTASGGPFYFLTKEELEKVTPQRAIVHPNWNMGKKISVDSATMFNKGLELIEARWLYDTTNVEYIIHRESVIHSMVEFIDGSIVAQLSSPDMELPIQQSLTTQKLQREGTTNFVDLSPISFYPCQEDKFPAPKLAKQLIMKGDTILPCVYSSANEVAVQHFLNGKIGFCDIYRIVEKTVNQFKDNIKPSIDNVLNVDREIREKLSMES
ncbi:MAG: 1-deoxy-D-xylulose-5-phosphate reductoisomerase [Clostridiales bacterium]|jgi:1-deoxy-D-xylulose-5-phosphate reductoisomerase|nr:1-deoxy-D-xylulose-5-phosphate reductoisomerase [Clostridiales bacterium]